MRKKLIITTIGLILALAFSFSKCFAADVLTDATDAIRNTIGGAENVVEDAVNNVSNTIQNTTQKAENTIDDTVNNMDNDNNNNMQNNSNQMTNNNTYSATRTSTDGDSTFMGMNATAWTWLILGIAGIAIIAAVWYYSTQVNSSNSNHSRRD